MLFRSLSLLPGSNPYDRVVFKTKGRFGYLDAKAREQSNGELLANEKRKQEIDISRGKLLTLDQHRESLRTLAETWLAHLPGLIDACLSAIPAEHQPAARVRLDAAVAAEAIRVADVRRSAALVMRAVMYSWFGNRFTPAGTERISAEETWEFCLHGLRADG